MKTSSFVSPKGRPRLSEMSPSERAAKLSEKMKGSPNRSITPADIQVAVEIDEYRDGLKSRRRGRQLLGVGKVAINLAGGSVRAKKSTSVKTHELATALDEELTDYSDKLAHIKEEHKVLTEEELHQQKIDVYAEDERHQVCGEHGYDISPVGLLRPDIAASNRLMKQVQTFPKCVACNRLGPVSSGLERGKSQCRICYIYMQN